MIGVFHRETGIPVAGVINQPFSILIQENTTSRCWNGRRLWGVNHAGHAYYSLGNKRKSNKTSTDTQISSTFKVTISGSESENVKETLTSSGIRLFPSSGAGNKLLHVIDDNVDFYVLSGAFSFKWDTCAAHAILCSMGGGVVGYKEALLLKSTTKEIDKISLDKCELKYNKPDNDIAKKWSNSSGLIAFKSHQRVFELLECFHS